MSALSRRFSRRSFVKIGLIYVPWLVLPHDMVNCASFLPVPSINGDTYTWAYGRIPAASSSISAASIIKADRLMTGLIRYALRPRIVRMNIFVGNDINALKAAFITNNGSAQEAVNNFVAGNYSEAAGITGGATKSIITPVDINAAPFGDNDLAFAVYVRTGTNEATVCMGTQEGGKDIDLMPSNGGTSYWDSNNAGTGRASVADSNGVGYYLGSRSSSSSSVLYKNGTSIASVSAAGGARPAPGPSIGVCCVYDSGLGPTAFTTRTISHYAVMLGLDATQAANMSRLIIQFETSMGRNV
jgi:hypothetical protein